MRQMRLPRAVGGEHLPPVNWKEKKQLGERIDAGYRLACQLWLDHDIELAQDVETAPPREVVAAAEQR